MAQFNTTTAAAASVSLADRSSCLVGAVDKILQSGKLTSVRGRGFGVAVIDPANRSYAVKERLSNSFYSTPAAEAELEPLPKRPQFPAWRPLDELIWNVAFRGASDVWLRPYQIDDRVRLVHWPNLTRVFHDDSTFALCAFLAARPSTFRLALKALHLKEHEGCAFYNAARASGCLATGSPPANETAGLADSDAATEKNDTASHTASFWSKLMQKIKGL